MTTFNSKQWIMDRIFYLLIYFSSKNKCVLRFELAFASYSESWRIQREGGGREKKAVMNIAKGRTKAARACTLEH